MRYWLRCYRSLLFMLVMLVAGSMALPATASDRARVAAHWFTFTAENGLAGNIVQALWEDPEGRIWFGTENGASRYDGNNWHSYRADGSGLLDNNVWAISGDADTVWFATSSGVCRLREARWRCYGARDGLANTDVRTVLVSRDGSVWAGLFGGGIVRKPPDAERWQSVELPAPLRSRDSVVSAIWQAPSGALWFSGGGFGALRLNGSRWERFSFRQANRNTVWAIGGDGSTTWMATFRGVVRVGVDDTVEVVDSLIDGVRLTETEVLAVATTADGATWFGTRAHGALRFADGRWQRFLPADGLGRAYVQSLLVDRAGRTWLGTRGGGVTLYDPQPPIAALATLQVQLQAHDLTTGEPLPLDGAVLHFDQNNLRLTFSATVPWTPTQAVRFRYWLHREGEAGRAQPREAASSVVSGSTATLTVQDTINLAPGRYTLHVLPLVGGVVGAERVVAFSVSGAPPIRANAVTVLTDAGVPLPSGITLPPALFERERQVVLAFAPAEDSTRPLTLRYAYRIVEQGDSWIYSEGSRARLLLNEGTNHIEVRAVDAAGNPSAPLTITVIVPGPFWITLLLYLVIVLGPAAVGGALGVVWYRRWEQRQALRRAVEGQFIPYDVGPLISAPERYIGRRQVIDNILGQIAHNSFYVYGEKRIGKSSLLAQLRQRLEQRNALADAEIFIPVFRNIQDLPQEQFWLALIRGVADAVGFEGGLLADTCPPGSYSDFAAQDDLERLLAEVAGCHAPRRPLVVLLLDEVDTLQRYDPVIAQRFRAFCQHMQDALQVVLVGVRPPRAAVDDTSPWHNIFAPVLLEPLDPADTLELIRHYNQNPYPYTPEAEQALVAAGDGKPFDTQWLCAEAVKVMLAGRRTRVNEHDVQQAINAVVRERRREYATLWQALTPALQAESLAALERGGALAAEQVALGQYDRLLEQGVALMTSDGGRLSALFRHWLEETR